MGPWPKHRQNCQHGAHHRCSLGCGATLGPAERANHNCYGSCERPGASASGAADSALPAAHIRKCTDHGIIRRQLADFLEEDDPLLMGAPQRLRAIPEAALGLRCGAPRAKLPCK